jgi:hypothetical protein
LVKDVIGREQNMMKLLGDAFLKEIRPSAEEEYGRFDDIE